MTDRDLYYCDDVWCDGHARSNDDCANLGLGLHAEAVVEDDAPEDMGFGPNTNVSRDRYTVSGNRMRIWRLDADGNPVGEAIDLKSTGRIEMDINPETDDVVVYDWANKAVSLDLTMCEVDPAVLALLTGQGTPPEKVDVYYRRAKWYTRFYRGMVDTGWAMLSVWAGILDRIRGEHRD